VYENKFAACDITNCCGNRLVSVSDDGIAGVDDCGRQTFIPNDTVVLAIGSRPNRELVEGLREVPGLKVVEAGDCVKPRKIFDAIHEGHLAARQLDWL
jgi:NADPH-dependent 2,4-dienoyl-CoA reductase/sulfur reductase-like enzyme